MKRRRRSRPKPAIKATDLEQLREVGRALSEIGRALQFFPDPPPEARVREIALKYLRKRP